MSPLPVSQPKVVICKSSSKRSRPKCVLIPYSGVMVEVRLSHRPVPPVAGSGVEPPLQQPEADREDEEVVVLTESEAEPGPEAEPEPEAGSDPGSCEAPSVDPSDPPPPRPEGPEGV